jgi:hypothetical protein
MPGKIQSATVMLKAISVFFSARESAPIRSRSAWT